MQQGIGARGAVGLRGVLELIVADAVLAGHKNHRRGHHIGEVAGVVAGAGGDAAMAVTKRFGRVLNRIDQFCVEYGRRLLPDRFN